MTCDECADLFGGAVEQSLAPADQAAVREHCTQCDACRSLLADLMAIRSTAGMLDRRVPSPQLWGAIVEKTGRRQRAWVPLAAAAALLIGAAGATWFYVNGHRPAPAPEDVSGLAQSAESEIQMAEQHYDKAIAALEQLTAEKQNALDPRVAEAIAQSLHTIDQAIADSRAALKTDPGSDVAQASLLEALRMKVVLLQETVSLMNARS